MVRGARPAPDVHIDVGLVHGLVAAQFPQWAGLQLRPVASAGWDNAIFRLGDHLLARLPCRRVSAAHVEDEYRWLSVHSPLLPLKAPVPLALGRPGHGYPWPWTVCRWLRGTMAATASVNDLDAAARSLARFVASLQSIDPAGGRPHEFRGLSLAAHAGNANDALAVLADRADVSQLANLLEKTVSASNWTGQPVWTHGDLHPANLLIEGRELSAVIDFGLLGVGDPACDLQVAWTYLTLRSREVFRSVLDVDEATWCRGQGWALQFGLRAVAYSADNPVLDQIGRRTLAEIQTDLGQLRN